MKPTYTPLPDPNHVLLECAACAALITHERELDHDRFHAALDLVAAVADASHDFTRNLEAANARARTPEATP